jgi:hypothetical protein
MAGRDIGSVHCPRPEEEQKEEDETSRLKEKHLVERVSFSPYPDDIEFTFRCFGSSRAPE